MRNLVVAVAMSLAVSACWNLKKMQMVNYLESNAPLHLCLFDQGVDPQLAISCLRNSPDELASQSCTNASYTVEQISIFKRCALAEVAREQTATHTTTCYPILGSVTCTGN